MSESGEANLPAETCGQARAPLTGEEDAEISVDVIGAPGGPVLLPGYSSSLIKVAEFQKFCAELMEGWKADLNDPQLEAMASDVSVEELQMVPIEQMLADTIRDLWPENGAGDCELPGPENGSAENRQKRTLSILPHIKVCGSGGGSEMHVNGPSPAASTVGATPVVSTNQTLPSGTGVQAEREEGVTNSSVAVRELLPSDAVPTSRRESPDRDPTAPQKVLPSFLLCSTSEHHDVALPVQISTNPEAAQTGSGQAASGQLQNPSPALPESLFPPRVIRPQPVASPAAQDVSTPAESAAHSPPTSGLSPVPRLPLDLPASPGGPTPLAASNIRAVSPVLAAALSLDDIPGCKDVTAGSHPMDEMRFEQPFGTDGVLVTAQGDPHSGKRLEPLNFSEDLIGAERSSLAALLDEAAFATLGDLDEGLATHTGQVAEGEGPHDCTEDRPAVPAGGVGKEEGPGHVAAKESCGRKTGGVAPVSGGHMGEAGATKEGQLASLAGLGGGEGGNPIVSVVAAKEVEGTPDSGQVSASDRLGICAECFLEVAVEVNAGQSLSLVDKVANPDWLRQRHTDDVVRSGVHMDAEGIIEGCGRPTHWDAELELASAPGPRQSRLPMAAKQVQGGGGVGLPGDAVALTADGADDVERVEDLDRAQGQPDPGELAEPLSAQDEISRRHGTGALKSGDNERLGDKAEKDERESGGEPEARSGEVDGGLPDFLLGEAELASLVEQASSIEDLLDADGAFGGAAEQDLGLEGRRSPSLVRSSFPVLPPGLATSELPPGSHGVPLEFAVPGVREQRFSRLPADEPTGDERLPPGSVSEAQLALVSSPRNGALAVRLGKRKGRKRDVEKEQATKAEAEGQKLGENDRQLIVATLLAVKDEREAAKEACQLHCLRDTGKALEGSGTGRGRACKKQMGMGERMLDGPTRLQAGVLLPKHKQLVQGEAGEEAEAIDPDEVVLVVHILDPTKRDAKSQEVVVRATQPLCALRDAVQCLQDTVAADAHRSLPSAYFCIENVFYNDMRQQGAKDYSKAILEWNREQYDSWHRGNGVASGPGRRRQHTWLEEFPPPLYRAARMEDVKFMDLTVHIGVHYLYLHQGDCKHILVVTDIRRIHPSDVQDARAYPVVRFQQRLRHRKCVACGVLPAKKVVCGDKLMLESPGLLCQDCYHSLHYSQEGALLYSDFVVYDYYPE